METEAETYKLRQVKGHAPLQKRSKGRGTDSLLEPSARKWFCRQINTESGGRGQKELLTKGCPTRYWNPLVCPGSPGQSGAVRGGDGGRMGRSQPRQGVCATLRRLDLIH